MLYGLDIGGTKIELAVFDDQLELQNTWRAKTPVNDYPAFLEAIAGLLVRADDSTGGRGSLGIGSPVTIDAHGCATSANIPCVNGHKLITDITARVQRAITFENDSKMFALSEANGGAGSDARYCLGVILGTGLAGGLCIDGELFYGRQKVAGEFGHIPLAATMQHRYGLPLRECGCGLTGCVEQYLAGPGLLALSDHFGGNFSSIGNLLAALREGDSNAETIFDAYIDCLACYFAQLTLVYDPEVIVLGGGLSNISEIYQRVPCKIVDYLFTGVEPPQILPPRYGDSSGVRGAALSGQRAAMKERL